MFSMYPSGGFLCFLYILCFLCAQVEVFYVFYILHGVMTMDGVVGFVPGSCSSEVFGS